MNLSLWNEPSQLEGCGGVGGEEERRRGGKRRREGQKKKEPPCELGGKTLRVLLAHFSFTTRIKIVAFHIRAAAFHSGIAALCLVARATTGLIFGISYSVSLLLRIFAHANKHYKTSTYLFCLFVPFLSGRATAIAASRCGRFKG